MEHLNEQLEYHLKGLAGHIERSSPAADTPALKLKPLAVQASLHINQKEDPIVCMLQTNVEQFEARNGCKPRAVRMPMNLINHLVGLMPEAEQFAFWSSEIKTIDGMMVGTTEDGTLVLN